jgi:hypothetical protein
MKNYIDINFVQLMKNDHLTNKYNLQPFHFVLVTQFVCLGLLEWFAHRICDQVNVYSRICDQVDIYSIYGTWLIEVQEAVDALGKWSKAISLVAHIQMHRQDCFLLNPQHFLCLCHHVLLLCLERAWGFEIFL